jgi:hypothetical protein
MIFRHPSCAAATVGRTLIRRVGRCSCGGQIPDNEADEEVGGKALSVEVTTRRANVELVTAEKTQRRYPVLVSQRFFNKSRCAPVRFTVERALKGRFDVHLTVDLSVTADDRAVEVHVVAG